MLRAGLARGLEILGYAFLFRLWMFASGRFNAPWDLLRVDILNCIGASLLVVGVVALPWPRRAVRIAAALLIAVAIVALAPLTWDSALARRLPAGLAGYIDGRQPGSFFPPFPWAGFAALGAAAGVLLASWRGRGREAYLFGGMAALGAILIPLGLWADRVSPAVYPRYDFWHTSPAYFAVKAGIVLLTMAAAYVFDKLPGQGPIRQLGRTSLLVYWVHLEIIYGDHVVPGARGNLPLGQAVVAVGILMLAMLALSYARTARWPIRTLPAASPARDSGRARWPASSVAGCGTPARRGAGWPRGTPRTARVTSRRSGGCGCRGTPCRGERPRAVTSPSSR